MAARALVWSTRALLGLSLTACQPDDSSSDARVRLGPCDGANSATCGVVGVDEAGAGGRTIEIAVVVIPATGDDPVEDPVFVLAGGPGQGAAALAHWVSPRLEAIGRDRDLVFVDLRGTGGSGPLACEFEHHDDLGEMLAAEFHPERLADCLASYGDVDLRHYSTAAAMDDLDEVRAQLGYSQINLLAISYGTRAALTYLQRHPESVRSMVLDGVVPLDRGVYPGIPAASEAALLRVLSDCRTDEACSVAFPGLERELETVLDDLETSRRLVELTHPRTGTVERVDVTRAGFLGVLRLALYSNDSTALIPLVIHAAHRGDYGPAAALALRSAKHSKSLSLGLYLTVVCSEELGVVDGDALRAASAGLRFFDAKPLLELEIACSQWVGAELPDEFGEPVVADAPTLLFSGGYDPVTPPEFGDHVAGQLGNARHVKVDPVHHGVWWRGCSPDLLAEFFADPRPDAIDVSCLDHLAPTRFFLSANGPRPLTRPSEHPVLGGEPELASKESP